MVSRYISVVTTAAVCVAFGFYLGIWKRNNYIRDECRRMYELRQMERRGRITAEKKLAALKQQQQQQQHDIAPTVEVHDIDNCDGNIRHNAGPASLRSATMNDVWVMRPIGILRSCYKTRIGTPRQGNCVPVSRATCRIRAEGLNGGHAISDLDGFSHVWIVFVFHINTNSASNLKAKVRPPRLNGAKVGLYSTRTPHRPNAIGLSLATLDRVDTASGTLYLSGVDLVDGTPVLDIKPYVPVYDNIEAEEAMTLPFADTSPPNVRVPNWIIDTSRSIPLMNGVNFSKRAELELSHIASRLDLYNNDADGMFSLIKQSLSYDVRPTHRRNEDLNENATFTILLDRCTVEWSVDRSNSVMVESIELSSEKDINAIKDVAQ